MDLAHNLEIIRSRIAQACARVNRDPQSVQLVAVTKTVDDNVVQQLIELGVNIFGENRAQQGKQRSEAFSQSEWHLIGTLQTNKVKLCRNFGLIHSLDRLKLAHELDKHAEQWDKQIDVLIQVNISNEPSKHGLKPQEVIGFAEMVTRECHHLNLRGLMGMAPFVEPEAARPYFRELAQLHQRLITEVKADAGILSMGMSNDFEVAIEEGATMVRIGSALFTEGD
ncbi:MAG: YggS family pyridoxal phosphate-dependent enzyme [Candidatus Wallacebacter cryptica]|jgi:pyridoxal phosphate enzyme (YggS family)|nr:YggS family pyridoxal phosphate-dependent enzyme [Bacillota bacterium]